MSTGRGGSPRWIFFDVDQTLCDFEQMMHRALSRSLDRIEHRWPSLAGCYTPRDLEQIRNRLADEYGDRPVPLVPVRRQMFATVLADVGAGDVDVDDITDHYLATRFADPVLFEDVRPSLQALQQHYRLGVISNGNSKLSSLGLKSFFNAEFLAENVGYAKPDPRIYRHAADAVGAEPEELIMVGDSYRNDVEAAQNAGWGAVWLRRDAASRPPAVINSLLELDALLG
ncbi:MAG TPA: HAD family hydrolase [Microlunatus sp.]